jgi:hypothetical protein
MTATRRLAAIAADVIGYSRLMGEDRGGASSGAKGAISCVKPKPVLYFYHSPDRTRPAAARRGETGRECGCDI